VLIEFKFQFVHIILKLFYFLFLPKTIASTIETINTTMPNIAQKINKFRSDFSLVISQGINESQENKTMTNKTPIIEHNIAKMILASLFLSKSCSKFLLLIIVISVFSGNIFFHQILCFYCSIVTLLDEDFWHIAVDNVTVYIGGRYSFAFRDGRTVEWG
jgi:hypothetical protein